MEGHPISLEKAKELLAGDLGKAYRKILMDCCAPIYWYRRDIKDPPIAHNGTLTLARTPKLLLGITAAHVVRQLWKDREQHQYRVHVLDEETPDLLDRVIAVSDKLDIATIALDEELVKRLGKTPLGAWPPKPPDEGKGIMIAGYPGGAREQTDSSTITFGLYTVIGVARRVNLKQVTWLLEPEEQLEGLAIEMPPAQYDLGGISGGPLIGWFESEQHIAHCRLSAIVTEHPDYAGNGDLQPNERLVAARADVISETGKIFD